MAVLHTAHHLVAFTSAGVGKLRRCHDSVLGLRSTGSGCITAYSTK